MNWFWLSALLVISAIAGSMVAHILMIKFYLTAKIVAAVEAELLRRKVVN